LPKGVKTCGFCQLSRLCGLQAGGPVGATNEQRPEPKLGPLSELLTVCEENAPGYPDAAAQSHGWAMIQR
ncbi:MAG: hypothetical protein ACYSW1_09430, partial [Planctomycetota bacterium]